MMANVNKTSQHHNKFQANSNRSSQVSAHGCMDRQAELVKLCEPQDRRATAEDNNTVNIYGAMLKNR
jgi:hypothetical protein